MLKSRARCAQVRRCLAPASCLSAESARCAYQTASSSQTPSPPLDSPFFFQTGYALFAKRQSRPLPPPFYTPPSSSFSDPLAKRNHNYPAKVNGEIIRGLTNGDDAILAADNFIGANDGVGAWTARPRGHAALWSRLILHFWAAETAQALQAHPDEATPVAYLQKAYERTLAATAEPNEWLGTTTAAGALLYHTQDESPQPILYVTNLGDSQVLVIRPKSGEILYKTKEQWHWFDCPRQLGTNSPDTPNTNAVCDRIDIEVDDIVLAMSDGVPDNLWDHEIVSHVMESLHEYEKHGKPKDGLMTEVARNVMNAAKVIAQDPFAESPFMERAVEEGLAMEGGKLDDISIVAACCQRRPNKRRT